MSTQDNLIAKAVRYALATGITTSLVAAPTAFAADEGDDERITVLGSRIKRTDIETAQPVVLIDREAIEKSGLTSIGDLLQELPSAGSAINTTFNNGGDGSTRIDLRNLGAARTLVLVNGRRWVTGGGGGVNASVDLNSIPVSVIESIEVLKDGASAVYGSDAIAGVVNITTRRDFDGLQANAYYGETSEGDGEQEQYDFTVGTTGDKGNVVLNVQYTKTDPIFAGDREISAEPQFRTGNAFGSSGSPQGRFLFYDANGNFFNNSTAPGSDGFNGGAADPDLVPWDATQPFNFAPLNYLLTPQERTSVYIQGSYEIFDDIDFSTTMFYGNRKSNQLLAPTPLFVGPFGSGRLQSIVVSGSNFYNPTGGDIFSPANVGANTFGFIGRRFIEGGFRDFQQDVDTYYFSAGFKGTLDWGTGWDWDINYIYAENETNQITDGLVNGERLARALGPSLDANTCADAAGNALTDGCVPFNIFGGQGVDGQGTITQAQVDYVTFVAQDAGGDELRNYTANITGELFDLPAGPVGLAAGYEHRRTAGFDQPDALIVTGDTSGNARQATSGGFSLDEVYVEFAVPLLADAPFAEVLELSLASRYSDYSNFGSTTNSKVGLRWKPYSDLLVRGTFSEGFRAPGVGSLFLGNSDSFPTISDPCSGLGSIGADTNNDGTIDAAEAAEPILPGCVGVSAAYQQPNPQIRITVGGNPDTQPEKSESYTFGLVYEPSYVDDLVMTLDWYEIELEDTITTVGAQNILNTCAATGTTLCNQLTRAASGNVTDLFNGVTNAGGTEIEGVDFSLSYSLPEFSFGQFKILWDSSYVTKYDLILLDGTAQPNAGLNLGDTAIPRWKSNLFVDYSYGDWEANYGARYIHHQTEACALPNNATGNSFVPILCSDGRNGNHIGGTTYHDFQVSYFLTDWNTRLTVGVNNAFDKRPPDSLTAFANSFDASIYDPQGRFYYVRVSTDF